MPNHQLCLTIRYLQPFSHGRGESGEPEWPPSPLRLYQAFVAAAAAKWNERQRIESANDSLRWLQTLGPPQVIAGCGVPSTSPYRLYVPDNVGDKVANSWRIGNDADIANYRTEKDVRVTHLTSDTVYYLYPLPDSCLDLEQHLDILRSAARSITHLGWGIDMVAGNAELLDGDAVAQLIGERWEPSVDHSGTALRVPVAGTLDALIRRHEAFLNRLSADGFRPVPPLTKFNVVSYRRETDVAPPSFAAFELLRLDQTGYQPFDTVRRSRCVAGMMRNMASRVAEDCGWPADKVARFVLGHAEGLGETHVPVGRERFAFLPLPSIERRGNRGEVFTSIRRVLVTFAGGQGAKEIEWARRFLSGSQLMDEAQKQPRAIVSSLRDDEWTIRRYVPKGGSATWATVTPVVLPGYDDPDHIRRRLDSRGQHDSALGAEEQIRLLNKLDARIEGLLRKAIRQAGLPDALARQAAIEWRSVGYLPGVDLASRYVPPKHLLRFARYHVRIRWKTSDGQPVKVPGPLCLGGGRYCGMGLFVADDER